LHLRIARHLPQVHPEAREEGIVVQHLLEMRHQPALVDAVAMDPASHLVVDPAPRHGAKGGGGHVEGQFGPGARPVPHQEVERHGWGELGGATEAAVPLVEGVRQ